ncbi:unnamed protein product [Arabidopsis halleri]
MPSPKLHLQIGLSFFFFFTRLSPQIQRTKVVVELMKSPDLSHANLKLCSALIYQSDEEGDLLA